MTKVYELIFDDYWLGNQHSIALSLDKEKLQKMLDVVAEFDKATELELQKDDDTMFKNFEMPDDYPLRLIDYDEDCFWVWHCGNTLKCFEILERELI
ncbi:MAG: hypothetical protein Q3971_03220 [Moraxella sp.]|nr:hypothetical protein [Moraxella sp.]